MKSFKRKIRFGIIITCGILILITTVSLVLSRYAEKTITKELSALDIHTSQINVNFLNRSVTAQNVFWSDTSAGTSPGDSVGLNKIKVTGIDLYQLLIHKTIRLRRVSLTDGYFRYHRRSPKTNQTQGGKSLPSANITINSIEVSNIEAEIFNDTIREYSGTLNLFIKDIRLADLNKTGAEDYSIGSIETSITNLALTGNESMYNTKISHLYANSSSGKIVVDSISLMPRYSKYRFSRTKGRQMDRFALTIPRLSVSGFDFGLAKDSIYRAMMVEIDNPKLHVYRDKRLPFIKHDVTPLPVAMIRSLPFEMSVDTIKINRATIRYEEFPEKGFRTGYVTFENLNATIDHVSNRDFFTNYNQSTIKVTSAIMGKGTIEAEFSLPYGKDQVYNARGVIKNLSLHRLNPILENAAFISVESGTLNQLNFNFDYDEYKSNGSVLINYEDLKITSLTKEKDSSPNEFKSWLLNTFLKNDKDKDVSKEKRTGVIQFERDRKRAIFNLWVKSLFSGLRSSVLDSPAKKKKK